MLFNLSYLSKYKKKYTEFIFQCALNNGRQRRHQCDYRVFQEEMDQLGNPLLHQPYQLHGQIHGLRSFSGKISVDYIRYVILRAFSNALFKLDDF